MLLVISIVIGVVVGLITLNWFFKDGEDSTRSLQEFSVVDSMVGVQVRHLVGGLFRCRRCRLLWAADPLAGHFVSAMKNLPSSAEPSVNVEIRLARCLFLTQPS
jgi:hypothetical protein